MSTIATGAGKAPARPGATATARMGAGSAPHEMVGAVLAATVAPLRLVAARPDLLPDDDGSQQIIHPLDKIAAETVLLLYVVDRYMPQLAKGAAFADLVAEAAKIVRSERHLFMLRANPRLCTSFGIGHVLLTRMGHLDTRFDAVFALSVSDPSFVPANKLPFRLMDDHWLIALHHRARPAKTPMKTCLAAGLATSAISPLYMNVADRYAFTHEIMYATDFGAQALAGEICRDRLLERIEIALYDCLWEFDLDLMAEFVACAAMITDTPGNTVRFCRHLLVEVFGRTGFLPSRSYDVERLSNLLDSDRRAAEHFFHSYHTTHVHAMMLCLTRHWRTAADSAEPAPGVVDAAFFDLSPGDQPAQWIGFLDDFACPNADKLRIANGVQLSRLARGRRFERLFAEIGRIVGEGAPVSTMLVDECAQAIGRIAEGDRVLERSGAATAC